MAKSVKYLYGDSNIFISYFNQQPERIAVLEQLFEEIQKSPDRKIVTSVITLTEVAHFAIEKDRRQIDDLQEERLDQFWNDRSLIEFVEVNEVIPRSARKLMRLAIPHGFSLKPADAIHLASARFAGAEEFLTYDDLKRYEAIAGLQIIEPFIDQPRLL
jgi:predicted nucleic acid-binding protein